MHRPRRRLLSPQWAGAWSPVCRQARAAATVVALLTVVGGCVSTPEEKEEPAAQTTPLAAFLGLTDATAADRARAAEAEVATCMQAAGFDYRPMAPAANRLPGDLTTLQDALDYGYGLTIRRPTGPGSGDPNVETYEALSPADRQRWDHALYGATVDPETAAEAARTTPSQDDVGCRGAAGLASSQDALDEALTRPEFQALAASIADLEARIASDQRVQAAVDEWSACMDRAGFAELRAPGDALEDMLDRTGQAVGVDVSVDGFDTAWLDHLADEELTALQAQERAMAAADVRCLEPFHHAEGDVRTRLEEEFVDANRSVLTRLRRAIQE